jgi:hypothetical protein
MAYRPSITLAEENVGGLLKLSLTRRSLAAGGGEEAGFSVTFDDHIDGDYPYLETHAERFRNLDDALMAFARRLTNSRPWLRYQARPALDYTDAGPSLSVPAESVKQLIEEVRARVDIDKNPENYYGAIFGAELARRPMSAEEVEEIALFPRNYVIRTTADADPSRYMEMALVNNPVVSAGSRPSKVIRIRSVTAVQSTSGEVEIETENGVEYFHDIHMATTAFEQRAAEMPDMPSGFGMQLPDDGGRDELKDSLLGRVCASIPVHAARKLVEDARAQGIDLRFPEIVDELDELVSVTYGIPDLVHGRSALV